MAVPKAGQLSWCPNSVSDVLTLKFDGRSKNCQEQGIPDSKPQTRNPDSLRAHQVSSRDNLPQIFLPSARFSFSSHRQNNAPPAGPVPVLAQPKPCKTGHTTGGAHNAIYLPQLRSPALQTYIYAVGKLLNAAARNGSFSRFAGAPCHVPRARRPFVMGTVSEQPNMLDFTCAGMSSSPAEV